MKYLKALAALLRALARRRDARASLKALRKVCIQLEAVLAEKRRDEFDAHGVVLDLDAEVLRLRRELGWSWPEEEHPA